MLHTDFTALCYMQKQLLPTEVLHCGNKDFQPFCSTIHDLDPMTFIYELTRIPSKYPECEK